MAPIATLAVRISAQLAEFQKAFADTSKHLEGFTATFQATATKAAAIGTFLGNIATDIAKAFAAGLGRAFSTAIEMSARVTNSLIGLSSVARAFGQDVGATTAAARRLSSDGLMPLADSATGLKNLLAAGFNLPQAVRLMEAFKDSAAFGRQSALSFGEAVRSATEGVKNGNSILVDNAGVTKNLSQILKEAGFSAQDLSRASSDAAVRLALYNGIIKETQAQTGDAAKLTQTYTGQVSRLDSQYQTFLGTLGTAVTQNRTVADAIGALGDVFGILTDRLVNNRTGFTLVSDAVIVLVRAFATLVTAVDLVQRAFGTAQEVVNAFFSGFAQVGIAIFKFQEKAATLMQVLDPLNYQRHASAVREARDAYTFLEGAVQGFAGASEDVRRRTMAWSGVLQDVRTRVDTLGRDLETTRGQTVELGTASQGTAPKIETVGEAAKGTGNWIKSLGTSMGKLEEQLQAAEAAGVPMTVVLEEFGNQIEDVVRKAPLIGKAVGDATQRAYDALTARNMGTAIAKWTEDLDDEARKLVGRMENTGREVGDAFWKAQATANDKFLAELGDLQRRALQLEDDSLSKRLALINLEYDEKQGSLDRTATLYGRHYAQLEAERRAALAAAEDDWREHAGEVATAIGGLFAAIGSAFDGWLEATLSGIGQVIGALANLGKIAKMTAAQKIGVIGQGIGNVIGATGAGSTATRVIGGGLAGAATGAATAAALGAKLGSAGGFAGAAIGAGIGALVGWLRSRSAEKEATKQIREVETQLMTLYGDMQQIEKIGRAVGVNLAEAFGGKGQKGLATLTQTAEAFQEKIDGLNQELSDIATKGSVASQELVRFRDAMADSAEVTEFVRQSAQTAAEGVVGFLQSATVSTQAGAEALGGVLAGVFATYTEGGMSARQALEALADPIAALQAQLEKTGFTGGAAFTYIQHLAGIAANEVSGPALDAIAGLTAGLQGAHNAGFLTQDMFAGLVGEILRQREAILGTGVAAETVNSLMQRDLQTIWQLQQDFGYQVDESTQALLDQAEAAGTVGDQFRSASDRAARAMERVANALEKIFGLTNDVGEALDDLPRTINIDINERVNRTYDNVRGDPNAPVNPDAPLPDPDPDRWRPNYAAQGGIVPQYRALGGAIGAWIDWQPRGTDTTPAMLTPGELVLTTAQQNGLAGTIQAGAQMADALQRALGDRDGAPALSTPDVRVLIVPREASEDDILDLVCDAFPESIRLNVRNSVGTRMRAALELTT